VKTSRNWVKLNGTEVKKTTLATNNAFLFEIKKATKLNWRAGLAAGGLYF